MKTKLTLLFGFIFAMNLAFAQTKFSSSEGKMSIKFPCDYEVENSEDSDATKVKAVCEDQLYYISYVKHESNVEDMEGMLQVSVDAFVETIEGTTKKQEEIKIKGHEALEAEIEFQGNTILYRVTMIGDMQYQLIGLGATDSFNRKATEKFLKSFKPSK